MSRRSRLALLLLVAVSSVQAGTIFGFEDVTALTGWDRTNKSSPLGPIDWAQGDSFNHFAAHAGTPDSYIAANYDNTVLGGTISNWLFTPVVTSLSDGLTFSFYTRTEEGSPSPDRLELHLSTSGASTDVGLDETSVGVFGDPLLTVNPLLDVGGYPEAWKQFSVTLSGVSGSSGRFGFRYYVTDASIEPNFNGNFIGIDSVVLEDPVPEPSTLALAAIGLGLVGAVRLRRRKRLTE